MSFSPVQQFVKTCLLPTPYHGGERWDAGSLWAMARRWLKRNDHRFPPRDTLARHLAKGGFQRDGEAWLCKPALDAWDLLHRDEEYHGEELPIEAFCQPAAQDMDTPGALRLDLMCGAGAAAIRDLLNDNLFDVNEEPLDLEPNDDELEAYGDLLADLRKDRRARLEWARDRRAMSKALGL